VKFALGKKSSRIKAVVEMIKQQAESTVKKEIGLDEWLDYG